MKNKLTTFVVAVLLTNEAYAQRRTRITGVMYSIAYYSPKQLGTGQFYFLAIQDKSGQAFDGGKNYRLNVPANPPAKLYWSVTAYDRETHQKRLAPQPLVAGSRDAEKRRRVDRRLLRAEGAARKGRQLGPDRSQASVRAYVSLLRADAGAVRQDVEAARRRGSEMNLTSS